jgi:hypothetical protein
MLWRPLPIPLFHPAKRERGERSKQTFFILLGEAIEPIVEVEHIQDHASAEGRTVVLLVDEVVPGLTGHG